MTQRFKENDNLETKFIEVIEEQNSATQASLDEFYNQAYLAAPLGDVLYDENRDPMVGVVTKETYRESFSAIHDAFTRPGIFEFYLSLFERIFGSGVNVEFEIPGPGRLNINVEAFETSLDTFAAREIVSNQYVYNDVVDHDGDFIVFQTPKGIKTQSEIDALIREVAPQGIFTQAFLTYV